MLGVGSKLCKINLTIKYLQNLERPWLIKRENGTYEQHAHCFTKKDAEKIRNLIDINKYPYSKSYQKAMQRLLTKEEYKNLNRKDYYFNTKKKR